MAFYNWRFLIYDPNEEETEIHQQLAQLQKEYILRAQPFIDRLVEIEKLKPPRPMVVSLAELSDLCLMEYNGNSLQAK